LLLLSNLDEHDNTTKEHDKITEEHENTTVGEGTTRGFIFLMPKKQDLDSLHRCNYLYQAATWLELHNSNSKLQTTTLLQIRNKQVIRLHPRIKRTICKQCCRLLVPGKTSLCTVSEQKRLVLIKCLECSWVKTLPANRNHVLFHDTFS
jgi:ribonuclease P protein subunit RPR2